MKPFTYLKLLAPVLSLFAHTTTQATTISEPVFVDRLLGNYSGADQLGRDCKVSVELNDQNELSFRVESSATEISLEANEVDKKDFLRKIEEDTKFRMKEDRDFNADLITVNYYINPILPSSRSREPREQKVVGVSWRDRRNYKVFSVSIEHEKSNGGPYIDSRQSIYCFGLKKRPSLPLAYSMKAYSVILARIEILASEEYGVNPYPFSSIVSIKYSNKDGLFHATFFNELTVEEFVTKFKVVEEGCIDANCRLKAIVETVETTQ